MNLYFKTFIFGSILFFADFALASKDQLMQPYFDEEARCFHNYQGEDLSHMWDSVGIFLKFLKRNVVSGFFPKNFKQSDWLARGKIEERSDSPKITWLGHSTVLIQVKSKNIITDPVLFDLNWLVYPRQIELGIPLKDLPKIDVILISHMHRDHVDEASLNFIKQRGDNPIVLAPKGSKKFFNKLGFELVDDFSWWEKHEYEQMAFHFLPAIHWSNRNLFDINKYLWGSWMIQVGNENIYFAGDSAYGEHYKQIASQFGNIDLALMPIGPVGPREIVKKAHMDAQEAVHAFIDLNAKKFTPIHWGTFALGTDAFDTALNQLSLAITENASDLDAKNLQVLKFGECISL